MISDLHSAFELRGVTGHTVGNELASTRSMVSFPSHVKNNQEYEDQAKIVTSIAVYMRIGGICAIVATASIAFFCLFAGLHCMMQVCIKIRWFDLNICLVQVNNKKICISYKKNILFALITAIIAGMHF